MTKVTAGPCSVPPSETSGGPVWLPAAPALNPALRGFPHPRPRTPAPGVRGAGYASGRTTALIGIEPAPAIVTFRPGRGAWTIAPSPTYIATWLASSK